VLLVPRSDEFEGQGQRSKVKVARLKTVLSAVSAACVRFMFVIVRPHRVDAVECDLFVSLSVSHNREP